MSEWFDQHCEEDVSEDDYPSDEDEHRADTSYQHAFPDVRVLRWEPPPVCGGDFLVHRRV